MGSSGRGAIRPPKVLNLVPKIVDGKPWDLKARGKLKSRCSRREARNAGMQAIAVAFANLTLIRHALEELRQYSQGLSPKLDSRLNDFEAVMLDCGALFHEATDK